MTPRRTREPHDSPLYWLAAILIVFGALIGASLTAAIGLRATAAALSSAWVIAIVGAIYSFRAEYDAIRGADE